MSLNELCAYHLQLKFQCEKKYCIYLSWNGIWVQWIFRLNNSQTVLHLCACVYLRKKMRQRENRRYKSSFISIGNHLWAKYAILYISAQKFSIIYSNHLFLSPAHLSTSWNDLTVTLPSHSDSHPDILALGITAGDCLESGNSSLTKCDFYITLS